jgi:hypothetical protein
VDGGGVSRLSREIVLSRERSCSRESTVSREIVFSRETSCSTGSDVSRRSCSPANGRALGDLISLGDPVV